MSVSNNRLNRYVQHLQGNPVSGNYSQTHGFAQQLRDARVNKEKVQLQVNSSATLPLNIDEGYDIQLAQITSPGALGAHSGWKCGHTDVPAYTKAGLKEPTRGPLFSNTTLPSPGYFETEQKGPVNVEIECGFTFKTTLLPKSGEYTVAEVYAAIDQVVPCIELTGRRYTTDATPYSKVALDLSDGLCGTAVVTGTGVSPQHFAKIEEFAQLQASVLINGQAKASGTGAIILDNPVLSLTWLVNHLTKRGIPVQKGHLVISGAIAKCKALPGDHCVAVLGKLAPVELTLA